MFRLPGYPTDEGSASAPDDGGRLAPGRTLNGRYRLIRMLASGGMASVWEGHDEILARDVAVKIPHHHLAVDPTFSQRFRREAVAAARLSHPNIVATYDTGVDHEMPFMVMELIRGRTLKQVLVSHGAQSEAVAVGIAVQVADALDAAHRAGLIHRDVKPANVLIVEDHRIPPGSIPAVKVADFGVARLNGLASDDGGDLTRSGTVVGTASYLAPEQVQGGSLDARTDVYALGVVLYEQLCGQPPFRRPTDLATALAHVQDRPVPVRQFRPDVSPELEAIVLACLAKSPDDRPPSAADLAAALRWLGFDGDDRTVATGRTAAVPRPQIPIDETAVRPTIRPDQTTVLPVRPSGGDRQGPPPDEPRPGGLVPAPPRRRSTRSRAPFFVLMAVIVAALVTGLVVLALVGGGNTPSSSGTSRTTAGDASGTGGSIRITSAKTIDPEGDGDENSSKAQLAVDGNDNTAWASDQYAGARFGNLKHGVGFYVQLNRSTTIHQVTVESPTQNWQASIFVAGAASSSLPPWGAARASKSSIAGTTTFAVQGSPTGQYVLVWITDPGSTNKIEISEIRVS